MPCANSVLPQDERGASCDIARRVCECLTPHRQWHHQVVVGAGRSSSERMRSSSSPRPRRRRLNFFPAEFVDVLQPRGSPRAHGHCHVTFPQCVSWVTNRGSVKEGLWWMSRRGRSLKSTKGGGARSWESHLSKTAVWQEMSETCRVPRIPRPPQARMEARCVSRRDGGLRAGLIEGWMHGAECCSVACDAEYRHGCGDVSGLPMASLFGSR